MNMREYKGAVEAMLFAHGEPIEADRLAEVLRLDRSTVERILEQLKGEYEKAGRGICLLRLENTWQLAAKDKYAEPVKKVMDTRRNTPLSQAALEVLAIIAYNQPVSRSFIEQVRGVDSSSTVATLIEKGLVEEAGRLDLPGRPISFRTTPVFLRTFGIEKLSDLPALHEELTEEPGA